MSGRYSDNDEILTRYQSVMGDKLGELVHRLQGELTRLRARWMQFRSLYGTSPERIDLLNRACGYFFAQLQEILWEDILLGIARITEAHREVISLRRIPPLLAKAEDRKRFEQRVKDVELDCSFAKDWRDRHIAHRNRDVAFNRASQPLKAASRQNVEIALKSIGDMLNELAVAFGGPPTLWDHVIIPGDNAEYLLHVLSDGIRVEEGRRKRFRDGTYTREDIDSRNGLWHPDPDEIDD